MDEAKTKNGILEGVIWKQLLLFFFPIMIGSFFQQLYNTADALILGRGVGKEALAAVGGSAALISGLLVNFFMGLTSGALRGMGDVVVPMLITMFGVCVVRVLWIMIVAGAFPTLEVVISNYPVTWILSAVAFIIYYRYKIKKIEAMFTR